MRTWRDDARISPNSHGNLEFQFDSVMTYSITLLNVFPNLEMRKGVVTTHKIIMPAGR